MDQIVRRWSLALACALAMVMPVVAASQDKATSTDVIKTAATVEDIDYAKRTMILKREDGGVEVVQVSPEVKRLKEVKKGDRIQVQVYQAVAVEMNRHGTQTPIQTTEQVQKSGPKERPGVAARRDVKSTVTINDVDVANNLVSVTGPRGFVAVLHVRRPEIQAFIKQLKPGDQVDVSYTEAVAISVERLPKK